MKKIMFCLPLVLSAFSAAAPVPGEYTTTVHVSASRVVMEPSNPTGADAHQKLDVTIEGKKYELESDRIFNSTLKVGDYKAKLIKDLTKVGYELSQTYEFLLPDNKTREFVVVGQVE